MNERLDHVALLFIILFFDERNEVENIEGNDYRNNASSTIAYKHNYAKAAATIIRVVL